MLTKLKHLVNVSGISGRESAIAARISEYMTPLCDKVETDAIGSLIAARCYEKLKGLTPDKEKALAYAAGFDGEAWSAALRKFLGKSAESMIALEKKEGKYNVQKHAERLPVILDHWQEILQVIDEELPSAASLEALLDRLGAPKAPAEIGIDPSVLPMTFKASKDIRDKYVLPRLAWDLGVLDEIADAL